MAFNKEQFIEDLKAMSVLELNEVVKAIEEEFGVSAAAPVAVAGAAEAGAVEEANKDVVLVSAGSAKLQVIKVIRAINSDLGLKDAKAIADNGGAIKENVPADEANELKAQLEEAGATIELK